MRVNARERLRRTAAATDNAPTLGLKPKDLVGIPWRVAFALQADGWYLRSRHRLVEAEPDAGDGDGQADESA